MAASKKRTVRAVVKVVSDLGELVDESAVVLVALQVVDERGEKALFELLLRLVRLRKGFSYFLLNALHDGGTVGYGVARG